MKSRSKSQGLVWGGLLIFFGAMMLVELFTDLSAWVWFAVLALIGVGILALYLKDRSERGLLITAYVILVIAGLVALINLGVLRDESVAAYVLIAIALPFVLVYAQDRSNWRRLIPAYVLVAVALMVALIGGGVLDDLLIPAYVMFAIAIPFFVVYLRDRTRRWPLIPGGIMAIIGLSFLIAESAIQYVVIVGLIGAGVWILVRQFIGGEPPASEA